jgi:Glycosyl hydrolase family 76
MTLLAPQCVAKRAFALAVAILLLGFSASAGARTSPSAPARARAAHKGAPQYPAGALRPAIAAKPDQFAHTSAAAPTGINTQPGGTSGGTGAGGPGSSKSAKKPATKPGLHGDPARALLAYEALQQNYYLQGTGLYKGEPYSFLWPFSQALAATVSLSNITGESTKLAHELSVRMFGLERYYEAHAQVASSEEGAPAAAPLPSFAGTVAPPLGPGGASYYDDNEWVGIELARIYKLRHETFALQQAKQIMAFVMGGWQTTLPSGKPAPCPGGVPFSNATNNTSRNTVTDAPAAELGVQLYWLTHEAQYLHFAEMAYAWVRQCLLSANGLYADHIQNNGEIEPMQWSYNQGTMMGAGTLLYQATGNSAYLYQARQTAKAALAYYTTEKLELENPFFACVYFRNLLYLDSVTHDPPGARLVQEYVNYAWDNLRLQDDLFVSGSPSTATLLGQTAIVQLYALLSTPAWTYF